MLKCVCLAILLINVVNVKAQPNKKALPVVCLVGGTPSSAKILDEIPAELKAKYRFISFNRPGFGNTLNRSWNENDLYNLAEEAGLHKKDFAVIGISGGGPLAILLADKFKLQYCGVISGMVPAKEYFAYADSTFTKSLMTGAADNFDAFKKTIDGFPNVEEILKQAASPVPVAVRACYDDLHFILTGLHFDKEIFKKRKIDWIHGENDKNVALESAQLFLSKFKRADLTILPGSNHAVDARILVKQLLDKWAVQEPVK